MSSSVTRLASKRRYLARKLGWRAFAGLCKVAGLALLFSFGILIGTICASSMFSSGQGIMGTAWLGLTLAMVFMVWRILLWLATPAELPIGICLMRGDAPALHRLIDRISNRFNGIRIDCLWITSDMNAAVLQRPRWGFIGPMETHLLIGLSLAHSIAPQQLSAILAHEFAHLQCQRRGWAAWGCHLRSWCFRVMDRCANDLPRLEPLLNWASDDFIRDALRLSRIEEYEADRVAAGLVGARRVGDALIEVALKERFLTEDYWYKVMAQSVISPKPLIRPYREMALGMVAGFRRPATYGGRLVTETGQEAADAEAVSMHPSLFQRLRALGVQAETLDTRTQSAAEYYLAPLLPKISLEFDRAWWLDTRRLWKCCYQRSRRFYRQQMRT